VGGKVFEACLRALAWSGRLVVVGFASGEIPSVKVNYLLLKHISVVGLHWSDYRDRVPGRMQEAQKEMFALARDGRLDSPVMATYRFEEYAEALAVIAGRRALGKIVLRTGRGAREEG
jgi:NADPH2:quinone reductase